LCSDVSWALKSFGCSFLLIHFIKFIIVRAGDISLVFKLLLKLRNVLKHSSLG